MSVPRVSIIMPAFNAARYIERAICSVLAQTIRDIELIVVDDASVDETWKVASLLAKEDSRVHCIHLSENGKAPHASNVAIQAASAEWVAVVDADDWIMPNRTETLLAIGERHESDVVADNQFLFDQQAKRCIGTALPVSDTVRNIPLRYFLAHSITGVSRFDYGMLKPLIRTDFLRGKDIRYAEGCHDGYDFQILLDLLVHGARLTLTEQPYYMYMQPLGSASRRPSDASRERYTYRYPLMQQHTDDSILRYRDILSSEELSLIQKRSQAIGRYTCYLQAKDALKNADLSRAFQTIRRNPLSIEFAGYAMLRRIGLRPVAYRRGSITLMEARAA